MKKINLIFFAIIFAFGLTACDFSNKDDEEQLGKTSSFYVANIDNTSKITGYNEKIGSLVAVGKYCRVWYVDQNLLFAKLTAKNFSEVASKFDSIYNKETAIFGSNIPTIQYSNIINVSSSSKIDILIYDVFDDAYENQTSGTFGFFSRTDMYSDDNWLNKNNLKSNKRQMFYIDSYFLSVDAEMIYSTLVHEFQHMLHFVGKWLNKKNSTSKTWYNEMLSLCAEEIFQKDLGISDNSSPKSRLGWTNVGSPLGFSTLFNNAEFYSGAFDYANAYYLGSYLMRNYGGEKIISRIALNNYTNEESITNALAQTTGSIKDFNTLIKNYGTCFADGYFNSYDSGNYFFDIIYLNKWKVNLSKFANVPKIINYVQGDSSNLVYGTDVIPYYYKADAQIYLLPTGFSVHSLGTVDSSQLTINLIPPSDSNIKVLFYCDGYSEDITSKTSYTINSEYIDSYAYLIKSNVGTTKVIAENTGKCTDDISYNIYQNNISFNQFLSEDTEDDSPKYTRIDIHDSPELIDLLLSKIK